MFSTNDAIYCATHMMIKSLPLTVVLPWAVLKNADRAISSSSKKCLMLKPT